MAIANALQLEAARRRAVPIRFNFAAHVKFEVAQPIRCRLRAFYCWYVTLRCDLEIWPRNLDLDLWPWTFVVDRLCHGQTVKFYVIMFYILFRSLVMTLTLLRILTDMNTETVSEPRDCRYGSSPRACSAVWSLSTPYLQNLSTHTYSPLTIIVNTRGKVQVKFLPSNRNSLQRWPASPDGFFWHFSAIDFFQHFGPVTTLIPLNTALVINVCYILINKKLTNVCTNN